MSLTAAPVSGGRRTAVIDVPGLAGVLLAHRALGAGADVLLMGEGIDVAHEIVLKERALRLGRLMLGAGAGGAVLGGVSLGYAPTLAPGPVAVLAPGGGAAREVAVLLDRAGVGVSVCLALGPRDLTGAVGAAGLRAALARLRHDGATRAAVAVLWPGDPDVVAAAVGDLARTGLPTVVVGAAPDGDLPDGLHAATTLEAAAHDAAALVGVEAPRPGPPRPRWVSGGDVRGLFTGSAVCAEAAGILHRRLGEVRSDPAGGGNVCLDLGDPARRGALPHPVTDPRVRLDHLRAVARDPRVRVVLFDLVLGHAAHPDPAGALAPALAELTRARPQVTLVAHVVGTERDPQGLAAQERALGALGVRVTPSNAAAARLAAALVAP